MTSRISATFARLASEGGRTGLIAYVTAGDPDLNTTRHVLDALVAAGVDIIELGVPFSDPMADGPVIQAAMQRALDAGARFDDVLEVVRDFRGRHAATPIVLFGYLNPLYRRGLDVACREAAEAGADGFLVVDLPPEEAGELLTPLREHGLDLVALFTPTSDDARVQSIAAVASGFAYYVSMTGVTGAELTGLDEVSRNVSRVRAASGLPVAVGFGIKTPGQAARVGAFADAVVVGSALVSAMAAGPPIEAPLVAGELMTSLREALDQATAAD